MTGRRRHWRRVQGFTLIEVMVSLAIVAIALAAGVQAMGALQNSAQRQSSALLAQLCAENALIEVHLSRQMPALGQSEFSCPQAGLLMGGTLSVFATPHAEFRRVEAQVRSDSSPSAYPVLTVVSIVGRF